MIAQNSALAVRKSNYCIKLRERKKKKSYKILDLLQSMLYDSQK